jgi:hypothetical protein
MFLGFSGFLLLTLLISITCVTLAQDDTLVLINNEEEESDYCNDIDEAKDDLEDIEKNKNIFYQKQTFRGLLKIKQFKTQCFKSLLKCINFPVYVYLYYLQWKQGIVNDFITVK